MGWGRVGWGGVGWGRVGWGGVSWGRSPTATVSFIIVVFLKVGPEPDSQKITGYV